MFNNCNDDEFQKVTYRKRNKQTKPIHNSINENLKLTCNEKLEIISKIKEAKEELVLTKCFTSFKDNLKLSLLTLSIDNVKKIICLGLGKISTLITSRYQLALLLLLQDLYEFEVEVFDPIFSEDDHYILSHFNITILQENLEGKYKVSCNNQTILFFPHCPKQLTNNFLWFNWGLNLKHCVLICNSFQKILQDNTATSIAKNANFILEISPYTVEIFVKNSPKYSDVFNDVSFHIFPEDKLKLASSMFFNRSEPIYDEEVEFIKQDKPLADI